MKTPSGEVKKLSLLSTESEESSFKAIGGDEDDMNMICETMIRRWSRRLIIVIDLKLWTKGFGGDDEDYWSYIVKCDCV